MEVGQGVGEPQALPTAAALPPGANVAGQAPVAAVPAVPARSRSIKWFFLGAALPTAVILAILGIFYFRHYHTGADSDPICAKAVKCCKRLAKGNPAAKSACKNYQKPTFPVEGCQKLMKLYEGSGLCQ